jgi:hypothetical protein
MATTARPVAVVTPTATAVLQRPPPVRGPPRRPAATRWTQPHAHIGRRCSANRSTAPCAIRGGAGGALDRAVHWAAAEGRLAGGGGAGVERAGAGVDLRGGGV